MNFLDDNGIPNSRIVDHQLNNNAAQSNEENRMTIVSQIDDAHIGAN